MGYKYPYIGENFQQDTRAKMSEWKSIKNGLPPVGYPLIVTIYDSCHNRSF